DHRVFSAGVVGIELVLRFEKLLGEVRVVLVRLSDNVRRNDKASALTESLHPVSYCGPRDSRLRRFLLLLFELSLLVLLLLLQFPDFDAGFLDGLPAIESHTGTGDSLPIPPYAIKQGSVQNGL